MPDAPDVAGVPVGFEGLVPSAICEYPENPCHPDRGEACDSCSASWFRALRSRMEQLEQERAEALEARDDARAATRKLMKANSEWRVADRELRAKVERQEAALREGRRLVNEMDLRMPEEAAVDKDDWIVNYRIPVGPWHRLLGWARGNALAALGDNEPSGDTRIAVLEHIADGGIPGSSWDREFMMLMAQVALGRKSFDEAFPKPVALGDNEKPLHRVECAINGEWGMACDCGDNEKGVTT